MRIASTYKQIADSLDLYVKNHIDQAESIIKELSNNLCRKDINNTLIEYDIQLLQNTIEISLIYCIATYSLNRYPTFISKPETLSLIVIDLVTNNLVFNQRNPLAPQINKLITDTQNMLANGQTTSKITSLIHVFAMNFIASAFYEMVRTIHDNKLKELNNEKN